MNKTPKKTAAGKGGTTVTVKRAVKTASKPPLEPKLEETPRSSQTRSPFYVVGIGGSAGALEAFDQFFSAMPADSGLAFVLVPHLDPTHKGMMPELLQRTTHMEVHQA